MAFQDFKPGVPLFSNNWVGFKHFNALFEDPIFFDVLRNTIAMSVMRITFGTIAALLLAVLLNETRNKQFKKSVQTITTLPHFISWTVAAGLVIEALSPSTGFINKILVQLNLVDAPIMFMAEEKAFWWISTFSYVWKEIGWSAIIYLAAMTGIDNQLYEAAQIDGANRLQRIWYVTLPSIRPTIIILLIISIGQLLNGAFEQQQLLQNGLNQDYALVFELFEIKFGLQQMKYSFAIAAGMFKSVVSIGLIYMCNLFSKKIGEGTLF